MSQLFTADDVKEIEARGSSVDEATWQVETLRTRPPAAVLVRPATLGDGIVRIEPSEIAALETAARAAADKGRVTKFVPASGAASRMFKELATAREKRDANSEAVTKLQQNAQRFAFGAQLGEERDGLALVERLLAAPPEGLGLADTPKGLIAFHRYGGEQRTPFIEHLYEAAQYATDANGSCRVHFTVSPESLDDFRRELEQSRALLEERTAARFDVTFSIQHESTDTLSIDEEGNIVRRDDGRLLFRPGGHGALLRNLEQLDGDLVAIKNIDNVEPEERFPLIVQWKRVLIGLAATIQQEVHEALRSGDAARARTLLKERFGIDAPDDDEQVRALLDRPLRVIGVVKNEGEPGGAPFWIRQSDGAVSLQIVESAQVDHSDESQEAIFRSSTHFNPVDIICALRDAEGKAHRLRDFVDNGAVFVAEKSAGAKKLRALELPGLWNGSMAHWNSVAVEVPAATFAPVKTVFDLLRPEHQVGDAT